MSAESFSLPNGVILHRWTDPLGQMWACAAYDHSPFCRLCQPVDDTLDACLQNAVDGLFDVRVEKDGSLAFHVTDEGNRRAKHMIQSAPDTEGEER